MLIATEFDNFAVPVISRRVSLRPAFASTNRFQARYIDKILPLTRC
jgi:hypothetical protein